MQAKQPSLKLIWLTAYNLYWLFVDNGHVGAVAMLLIKHGFDL